MRAGKGAIVLVACAAALAGDSLSAHRLDEYLHATRLSIEPGGVHLELSLTPGMAVAEAVIRDIDADGDTQISSAERAAYARQLLRGLSLHVDGTPLPMTVAVSSFPEIAALRGGDAAIVLRLDARAPQPLAGAHQVSFRNANAAHGAVYLANALLPDDRRIAITAMQHAIDQSGLTVAFMVR